MGPLASPTRGRKKQQPWRARAPAGGKIKKANEARIAGYLKKRVGSTRFVYFHRVAGQQEVEMRRSIAALKINTEEVVDISRREAGVRNTDEVYTCAHFGQEISV